MKKILALAVALVLLLGLIPIAGMMNATAEEVWTLVTDASTLKAGDKLVIACNSKGMVAGSFSSKYFTNVSATFSSDKSTLTALPATAITFTLGGSSGKWTLTESATSKLVGTSAAKTLKLGSGTTTWTIEIASKNATVKSTTTTYGWIQYNASSPRFLNYASNQTAIQLYRLEGGDTDVSDATTTTTKPVVIYNTPEEILNAAEALEADEYLSDSYEYTLTGVITKVDSAYSNYRNVTVTMKVDGTEKTISCYRLAGTGANKIAVGDTITVKGAITKHNTTVQFGEGCQLASYTLLPRDSDSIEIPEGAIVTTFEFGANGEATHVDGDALSATKSYTSGDYTLALTGVTKVYGGAFDAKGNSCLKLATGSAGASFSFIVPDDVVKVIVKVAGYKDYPAKVKFNDVEKTIVTTLSNDGEYTEIEVDTTENKTVTIATTASNYLRAMIDSITFVAVEQEEEVPTFTGRDLTLGDDLDVGFYLDVPESFDTDGMKVVFEVNDQTAEVALEADETGKYIIHLEVPAKDMTTNITASVTDADGNVYATINTTVLDYAKDIIDEKVENVTPEDVAVAKAMVNYGAMAQIYFDHNATELPNVGYESDLDEADVSAVEELQAAGDADGFLGATLVLKSKLAIRLYFSKPVDGAQSNANGYFIEIANIGAGDLDKVNTVTIDGTTYTFSALSFAKTVIEGEYDADFQNLMKALVLYSAAVEDM